MDGNDSFYWTLARVFFGISLIWEILGMFCNSLILLTTIKTRSMRSTYNILIALCAVGDIFHQAACLVQLPLLLGIHLEIDSGICIAIMFLPEMGIAIGCSCILCIGLDRLISVLFPTQYRLINRCLYHSFIVSLVIGYCAYLSFLMIYYYEQSTVVCGVVAPFLGPQFIWFISGNFTLNSMSLVLYFITWLRLRSHTDSIVMKRIVKSLFIIALVDVSGWFLTTGLIIVLELLDLENQEMFAWTYFSAIFLHIAISVKLFIYYSTSSEYRSAIAGFLFKNSTSSNSTISLVSRVS